MKETVLDVLMYLFESYVDSQDDPEPNRHELKRELGRAGFHDPEIERALVRQEVLAVEAGRSAELEPQAERPVGDVLAPADAPASTRVGVSDEDGHEQERQ